MDYPVAMAVYADPSAALGLKLLVENLHQAARQVAREPGTAPRRLGPIAHSPGCFGFGSDSSFALPTAVSRSFCSWASAASRHPSASRSSLMWLRSVLLPYSRRLSGAFSWAAWTISVKY